MTLVRAGNCPTAPIGPEERTGIWAWRHPTRRTAQSPTRACAAKLIMEGVDFATTTVRRPAHSTVGKNLTEDLS